MGRRPIAIGKISPRVHTQEGRYLVLAFHTERGASHLRARCARGSANRRCSLQFAPRPSSASQPPCWLDASFCKPVAAMSEPGLRFQSAILAYVILQLSLCRRAKFLRLRRARSTAADISTPRGCASCAHLRGVYLSFSKAPSCQQQGERKHKHCLLPCLVLCAASSHARLLWFAAASAAAHCCWLREQQWRLRKAILEIVILQGSLLFLCGTL